MLNKVQLIGNLGRNPETRSTTSGTPVTNFSMATTRRFNRDGERQEKTEWHNVVCFGRLAEVVAEYLSKGRLVFVQSSRSDPDAEPDILVIAGLTTEFLHAQSPSASWRLALSKPPADDYAVPPEVFYFESCPAR